MIGVNYSMLFYVYIQFTQYFQTSPTYNVTPGISFMQIIYSLPSECCDTMDKINDPSNCGATTTQRILRVLSVVELKNSNVQSFY